MYKIILIIVFGLVFCGCASKSRVPKSCGTVKECSALVMNKIQSNLVVDESFKDQMVKVNFHLDEQANVVNYSVIQPSQLAELNEAVKAAVYASSPFSEVLFAAPVVFTEINEINLTVTPYFN